jgi:mycothiol synthase
VGANAVNIETSAVTEETDDLWPIAPVRPQLVMKRSFASDPVTPPSLAPGYLLRAAQREESEELATVLSNAFPDMAWSSPRVREVLIDAPDVSQTFVITWDRAIVGTASVRNLPTLFPNAGIVHWVAVHQDHRGNALGRALTERVCEQIASDGFAIAFLETDDHRLPAIKAYLSLGFEPHHTDESHPGRWEAVMTQIKSGREIRE